MKKVGLITYYGDNYGGVLQAYALQQMVKANGMDCQLISNDFLYQNSGSRTLKNKWSNLTAAIQHPRAYLAKRKTYHQNAPQTAAKAQEFEKFRQAHLSIYQTGYTSYEQYVSNPPAFDVYLCGSDQIWNPNLYCENGFYFGGFASEQTPVVSYASSIGIASVNKKQAAFMAPLLNRLELISTREQTGAEIVNAISEKTARVVLDPTLLLNGEDWSKVAAPRKIAEPYVFCYLFGEREYIAAVKKQVKEMTGMKLVCIPYVARELDSEDEKVFDAGPAEFISLIKHASLVVTDSFHATAFSINLQTPFISLCRFDKSDKKGMNDRLVTILNLVGLSDRLVDANDSVSEAFLYDVDFEKAHQLLNEKRAIDRQFLTDALHCQRASNPQG